MTITTYNVLTGLAYITLVIIAIIVSLKKGEKEGSVFMLQYLRENKFFNDTDYYKFMRHIRSEKRLMNMNELDPQDLKKNEKEEDISDND